MHSQSMKLLCVPLVSLSVAFAANPIGVLTSAGSLRLNGVSLPVEGVPNWPLTAGDEIITGSHPAVIVLHDQSRVKIDKKSRVMLKRLAGRVEVWILAGTLADLIPKLSETKIRLPGQPGEDLDLDPSEGEVTVDENGGIIPPRARTTDTLERIPPRTRPPFTTEQPPGLQPRSLSSSCTATTQALPARARCL